MSDEDRELTTVLVEFEQRLGQLEAEQRLTKDAPQAFRTFRELVDRRMQDDRRDTPRSTPDRRESGDGSA